MEELVFALPAADLWSILTYKEQGLIKCNSDLLKKIVQKGRFHKRNELEENPLFKQVIPYAVISCEDSFYLFRRISAHSEQRLQDKFSLGAGGHMNPADSMKAGEQYLIDELKRELFEEVRLVNGCFIEEIEFIGFINDDTIPVGRVHIGVLYNIRVSDKGLLIKETDKLEATWTDRSALTGIYEEMETWSQIVFDQYIR